MDKKKNILLILSDQQRMDTVSAYGLNEICKTPNIDALAEDGMKFTNAYTSSAICSPSRASILTGLFPHNHGVIDNFTDIKPGIPLLSEMLQDEGYFCGLAGKWHISPNRTPEECGFDDAKPFMGYGFPGSGVFKNLTFNQPPDNNMNYYAEYLRENGYKGIDVSERFMGDNPALQIQEMFCRHDGPIESTIEYFVTQETIRLLEKASRQEAPFFIWTNFWGPHTPIIIPEPYFSMYNPSDIPEHPSYGDNLLDKPYGYYLTEKMWGLGNYGWRGFQEITARYYGHCSFIDDMVGKILGKLHELGMFEDTIVVYSSDHGDCMGAHKMIEKGMFAFEEIYKVPLVVHGAGHKDSDSMVYLQELMPTFLEIAGTVPREPVDGESFWGLMTGSKEESGHEYLCGEFHNHFYVARQRFIKDKDYWFTFNESERGELYDLKKDPYQLHNVCYDPAYAEIKKSYRDKMAYWMKRTNDPAGVWFHRIKEFY